MKRIESKSDYNEFYNKSMEQTDAYWAEVAESFTWKKKWDSVLSGGFENLDMKWFDGGKLNITENCIDRHLKDNADKVAIIWESNDPFEASKTYTYKELHENVCRFANVLKDMNVKKGDRVTIYLTMIPELAYMMLACSRIGAIHSIIFGGFSADSIAGRIQDCKSEYVITADEGVRGGKIIPLKKTKLQKSKSAKKWDIVGPICESSDTFGRNRIFRNPKENDILAICSTGAYGFVMSSNYNSRQHIPEILISGKKYSLIRKRQKMEHLIKTDILPHWL